MSSLLATAVTVSPTFRARLYAFSVPVFTPSLAETTSTAWSAAWRAPRGSPAKFGSPGVSRTLYEIPSLSNEQTEVEIVRRRCFSSGR